MSKSRFRLEQVLRIRRIQERTAALAAAEAASVAQQAEMAAAELDHAAATAVVPAVSTGAGFAAAMVRGQMAAAHSTEAHAHAVTQRANAATQAAAWTTAAQRMKGLERLKERHAAGVQRALENAETRTVDDLVTRAHVVRSQSEGRN
jgi:flagellar FliJ protein